MILDLGPYPGFFLGGEGCKTIFSGWGERVLQKTFKNISKIYLYLFLLRFCESDIDFKEGVSPPPPGLRP